MKSFSVLVKPVSFDCNLRCEYCFYLRAAEVYPGPRHLMTDAVLDALISQMLSYGFPETVFGWQGGEPTLAGLDFFRRVVDLQMRRGRGGQVVGNGLQTNGLLIDGEWAAFLAKYRFLVGISLDGPKEIHNRFRRKGSGAETFHLVLRSLRALKEAHVETNALTLVSQSNVRKARVVYRFLIDQGFTYLQFIPCVEVDPRTGKLADFAVSGEEYGDFLCEVFDLWKETGVGRVCVRDFDAVRRFLLDGGCDLCVFGRSCDSYLLVEHNGDVYPCDFFMTPEWRLGNLTEAPLAEIHASPGFARFSALKSALLAQCEGCEWVDLCHGGCVKDRLAAGDPARSATALCAGYKKFFAHAAPVLKEMK